MIRVFASLWYLLPLILAGCNPSSEYEAMLRREMARTDTVRTLFFNYELGMSRQAFYDSSWALNRKGMVVHGPNNQNVQYDLPDQLPHEATMLYYPDFKNEQIYQMRILFSYKGWAPWNRHLWSDSLIFEIRKLMETWYGDGFIAQEIPHPIMAPLPEFVKIDANRKIAVHRYSDREVQVKITDLRATDPVTYD